MLIKCRHRGSAPNPLAGALGPWNEVAIVVHLARLANDKSRRTGLDVQAAVAISSSNNVVIKVVRGLAIYVPNNP